ncbi:DUF3140 domain-containing protein [Actinomadura decatromicini]|uniref:DUF3140 domain-containing protein n=1 Tax=Actinomadura decatromicini TaxID=2604572 RepID=A0A5D3FFM5_9ACTN|nr:DUF3140 domain-containing protein [Actinomadura decatromicini]TYK46782.1 DUF3140 domain-containing protein [Actinomadura decatromicini]
MNDRIPVDTELAWEDFHRLVNMTSDELRNWLLTDASGEEAFPEPGPGPGVSELGARVVDILRKRKVDLTDSDTDVMRRVVDYVEDRLDDPPREGLRDDAWRHALMTVGHDPLRPEPSRA